MGLSWTDRLEDVSAQEWDSVLVLSFRPSPFLSPPLAGFPPPRSPPAAEPRGWVPFDRLPPPAVRRPRAFLPSGGDGPVPVCPPPLLLRRVPSAPGEEGAARTAQADAARGGNEGRGGGPRGPGNG